MLLSTVHRAELYLYQQFSSDLTVIADTDLGLEILRIAWPLNSYTGRKTTPDEFLQWLVDRNLALTCLCLAPDGSSRLPCTVTENSDHTKSLTCSQGPDEGCSFQLDLDRIYHSTELGPTLYFHFTPGQSQASYDEALHNFSFVDRLPGTSPAPRPPSDAFLGEFDIYRGYCGSFRLSA